MLAIARRTLIRDQLMEHKSVRITELSETLNCTKETIRRDLLAMEEAGELIRTHGGAYILDGVQNDIDVSTRQVILTHEKEIIAEKCATQIIKPGDFIYLDSSTTCWCIAKRIINEKLTVLTPSLEIANILSQSKTIKLYIVGGQFSVETLSFIGDGAIRTMQNHFVDKAFISSRSASLNFGMSDTSENSALMHLTALEHTNQKYLVVDHTKLDKTSFSHIASLDILTGIVMDQEFSDSWIRYMNDHNIKHY